jgi:hypothetical protein
VNDIPTNHKKNKTYSMLFADDLVFYYICKKGENAASKNINSHFTQLYNWTKKSRLKLATHKCNYLVFSNGTQNESDKLNIKINNEKLRSDNNPTFLGIRFDNHLSFKNQIAYLKETCIQRLNIIKILSHKSWSLNKTTLIQIYNVLIRSVLEYSAILAPAISSTNLNTLQIIQNSALRIILKKPIFTRTRISDLHQEANIELIKERFDKLRFKYIKKTIDNNNPIIKEVINEYIRFKGGRNLKCKTLLCDVEFSNLNENETSFESSTAA